MNTRQLQRNARRVSAKQLRTRLLARFRQLYAIRDEQAAAGNLDDAAAAQEAVDALARDADRLRGNWQLRHAIRRLRAHHGPLHKLIGQARRPDPERAVDLAAVLEERARPSSAFLRRCSKCGCTEAVACVTNDGPCSWSTVNPDICTACEAPPCRPAEND